LPWCDRRRWPPNFSSEYSCHRKSRSLITCAACASLVPPFLGALPVHRLLCASIPGFTKRAVTQPIHINGYRGKFQFRALDLRHIHIVQPRAILSAEAQTYHVGKPLRRFAADIDIPNTHSVVLCYTDRIQSIANDGLQIRRWRFNDDGSYCFHRLQSRRPRVRPRSRPRPPPGSRRRASRPASGRPTQRPRPRCPT
jgi:hypothetical protein